MGLDSTNLVQRDLTDVDSLKYKQKYVYTGAKVINNNYRKNNNYLTIDKGSNHGLESDLAVINGKGIVGITKSVSGNYATVLSILNVNSRINAKLLNTDHYDDIQQSVAQERLHYFLIGGYVFDLDENTKLKPAFLVKGVSGAPLIADLSVSVLFNNTG